MNRNHIAYRITGWQGIAGGISTLKDWSLWAQNKLTPLSTLPTPELEAIPSLIRRRLGMLGRCVMSVFAQSMHFITTEPAVIAVSRHGDLTLLDKLITSVREHREVSPTVFAYSVHNRLSSAISMFAGYRNVNGAYSSVRDGFQLALLEAASLMEEAAVTQALVVAYEPTIPPGYHAIIAAPWVPHAAVFVLEKSHLDQPGFSLSQHANSVADISGSDSGTCLPLIRTIMQKKPHRDGCWEHRYHE